MSTSLLYHEFGVRDYRDVRTNYIPGCVVFTIERRPETCRCVARGWRERVAGRVVGGLHQGRRGIKIPISQ